MQPLENLPAYSNGVELIQQQSSELPSDLLTVAMEETGINGPSYVGVNEAASMEFGKSCEVPVQVNFIDGGPVLNYGLGSPGGQFIVGNAIISSPRSEYVTSSGIPSVESYICSPGSSASPSSPSRPRNSDKRKGQNREASKNYRLRRKAEMDTHLKKEEELKAKNRDLEKKWKSLLATRKAYLDLARVLFA
jgi:hypothetical protein